MLVSLVYIFMHTIPLDAVLYVHTIMRHKVNYRVPVIQTHNIIEFRSCVIDCRMASTRAHDAHACICMVAWTDRDPEMAMD